MVTPHPLKKSTLGHLLTKKVPRGVLRSVKVGLKARIPTRSAVTTGKRFI